MCPRKSRKSSECFPILRDSGLERAAVPCPLLEGKEEAWVACCSKRFFPLARRIAGEDDLAQEVLQESWAKILKAIHAYRGGSPACAWVHAIVSHSAIKAGKARSKAREREVPIAEHMVEVRTYLKIIFHSIQFTKRMSKTLKNQIVMSVAP